MRRYLLFYLIPFILFLLPLYSQGSLSFDFSLPSLKGGEVSLKSFLGKKVMVINFWASWCEACYEEVSLLNDLKARTPSPEVVFLAINQGEKERQAERFLRKTGFGLDVLMDPEKKVARKWNILSVPQTLVISKRGDILYQSATPPSEIRID